ncbi:MAG: response regulator transcription factor [Candidatus Moranbacteria bacterium]|nr:response regulator transcription factor [Candidatus Moranbacteria bacterium]
MRILVIEDDESIARFLTLSLEAECFVVDTTTDGEDGSYLARTNEYDVIILDNVLPKKSGREVCAEIRRQGITVPILMLSAVMESNAKVELLDTGADDYLTKPFSLDELLARVRALLRRPKHLLEDILRIDNLSMDVKRHIVTRNDAEIRLTRKEFILLEYLLRNQGVVLSRSSIMDHVWDMHADPFSNTIESHILSVRKKIDSAAEKKLIHTVSGRGYVMDIRE